VAVAQRIYAEALFDAAKEKGSLPVVREQLADFAAASAEVPELRAVLRNPQLDPRAKAAVLEDLLGEADPLLRNFLLLLAEKGRVGELEEIAVEFERLMAREERRLEVELTTATMLSDEEADEIAAQIASASGRQVDMTRKTDPDLIGGIVLQAGSLRLDASVRGRLERLRHELARS
jgi:F-type H+-transporting ATPase subunit delta